jgi:HEPN domain-containing protein/predicted nucleotidyltransferase
MKTSIDFLPEHKQQELHVLVDVIHENYSVERIILFGSYARNKWVEEFYDDGFHYKYQSDFDIFVITETKQVANKIENDSQIKNRIDHIVKTPVTIIAHDIEFFNRRLRKGQFFFSDIKKEGICLYNSGRFELAEEKELSPKEYKYLAEEDFEYWYKMATSFYGHFVFDVGEKNYRSAAFMLHQTAENLYSATLLVLTRYKPNTHDLEKLGKRVTSIEPTLLTVFPLGTEEEKRRFELLRKAYVDARYNRNYVITSEELSWLAERVEILQEMTKKICQKKIDSFEIV